MTARSDKRKTPGERAVLRRQGAGFSIERPVNQPFVLLRSLASGEVSQADEELLAAINELGAYIGSSGFTRKVSTAISGGIDRDAIHDNVKAEINAIAEKSSPASGDWLLIEDSAESNTKKKAQVGNLPGGGGGGNTDELLHLGW
jgi:hypothetical protein